MHDFGHQEALERLLREATLGTVFQPIFDLAGRTLFGFEAMTRGPADSALHSPLVLFAAAARHGRLPALDFLACAEAGRRFRRLDLPGTLFLNVSSPSLVDPAFRHRLVQLVLNELQLNATRIVLEITEQQPLDDFEALRAAAGELRAAGFSLALDDLGAGHAGLRAWSEIQPEYVKIDRHFIENIHEDAVKRDFVRSIQSMGRDLHCRVIAEGIETAAELDVVRQLGIGFGQGYLLGRPKPAPGTGVPAAVLTGAAPPRQFLSGVVAADIAQNCFTIAPHLPTEQVLDLLLGDASLGAVPVVESDGRPLGLVLRHELADRFSARYWRELHGRKPIRQFMRADFIGVEDDVGLEEISRQLTSMVGQDLPQVFLVTRQGRFAGVGRTQTLLRLLTELQIRNACHSNPLTQLPGNVPTCELIDRLLAAAADFHVAYFDINHFKPFNDAFGFARGDVVLQMTADIIKRHCAEPDAIGHIGGDDFVVLFRADDGAARCRAIQADFDREIRHHYPAEALAAGGMFGEDRQGRPVFHPVAGLAIGLVHPDPALCASHYEVSELAVVAKREAKKMTGSALFVCRRHGLSAPKPPELDALGAAAPGDPVGDRESGERSR